MVTRRGVLGAGAAVLGTGALGAAGLTAARDPRHVVGPARGEDLHVMTYNLRVPQPGTAPGDPDHWPDREPLLTRLLAAERPTLLGVQEATVAQLGSLDAALPGHRLTGFGYGAETLAGHPALLHDPDRLELGEWGQHALSDTPEVVDSIGWGSRFPRSLIWARLTDRRTDRELGVVVTHLDHESAPARLQASRLVAERVATLGLPTVVLGDFNADAAASAPSSVLLGDAGLSDAWTAAGSRVTPDLGTLPGYGEPVLGGRRVDWVLTTPEVDVRLAAINATTYPTPYGERRPSDHTPVQALVRLA